jgi:hypothetical protein
MTIKLTPTACLVLAALISGCQDTALRNPAVQAQNGLIETNQSSEEDKTAAPAGSLPHQSPIVIAYYFHRTVRCQTCLAIEASASRVVEEDFSQQVAEGRLIWIPYNLDESDGKDMEKAFDVSGSTLVLTRMDGSNHTKYKKLENVWELIGDSTKFDDYVRAEVQQFLNE